MKQAVTLTGLASQHFHSGVRGVGAVYHAFKMFLGSHSGHLRTWAPGCDGGESLTLSFSNRILSPAKDAEGDAEVGLEHVVDPLNILRPLLRAEVHTKENHVSYWMRTSQRVDDLQDSR